MDLTALQKRFGKDRVLLLSAKPAVGWNSLLPGCKVMFMVSEHAISGGAYVQNTRHEKYAA